MQSDFININLRLDSLTKTIVKEKRKYYHLKSIFNFLLYLPLIKNPTTQRFVIEKLDNYFDYVETQSIEGIHESLDVFNKFIKPVGEIYETEFGFFIMIKPWILNISIIILGLILYSFHNRILFIIFGAITALGCFYLGGKFYKNKTYAFMW